MRVNEAAALAMLLEVAVEDLVRSHVSPVAARVQQEASAVASAEQSIAKAEYDMRHLAWLAEAHRGRLEGLQVLAKYVEAPSAELLTEALRVVIPRFASDEEWKQLLSEAGIERELIDKAYDQFVAAHELTRADVPRVSVRLEGDNDQLEYSDPTGDPALTWVAEQVANELLPLVHPQDGSTS